MLIACVLIGTVAFLASWGTTAWLSARPAFLVPLDRPNGRSLHRTPMPRTGGLAILTALALAFACAAVLRFAGSMVLRDGGDEVVACVWVLLSALALGLVSYWDDRRHLSLSIRLTAQCLAATGIVVGADLRITSIPIPTLGAIDLGWMAVPFSILFLMWMSNLYNFMDGMDGFAGGMTVVGFGCLAGLAMTGGHPFMALTAWYVVAAAAGFLAFNLPPARIFMGDIGSVPLGFLAGGLSLIGIQHALFDPWVPALIFSPFIVDATVTLIRRAAQGKKVWQAHREHYYQRVVLAGWGHRRTVMAEYLLMIMVGLGAFAYLHATEDSQRLLVLNGAIGGFVSLGLGVSMLEQRRRSRGQEGLVFQALRYRKLLVGALHLGLIVLANYLAFWLRFDGEIPDPQWTAFLELLPWLLVVRGLLFVPFRLYEGLWRYTGIWDLRNIIGGVLCSTVLFYLITRWGLGAVEYPRSVYLIDALVLLSFLSGIRLTRRILREVWHVDRGKRLLIYGAGDIGATLVPELLNDAKSDYVPVGFVSDDPTIVGQRINGVKVLGTRTALPRIVANSRPDAVLVAVPEGRPQLVRELVRLLEPYKVRLITVPSLRDVLAGTVEINRMRDLSIEDLLERAPIGLDSRPVQDLIEGKRVLVTGAGGSIGSELCRQIATLRPERLVLLDRYENGLFAITNELELRRDGTRLQPVIGDVTDGSRVNAVMREHRPQIVFHAAAHKHVPMMEGNPCEAVKNNVLGTRTMVEAAERYLAERFILISTDKAVNPCNVMGATKRVAEFLVQRMNHSSRCIFSAVRFGNVLGSNGSVVPRFLAQIKAGGPVTVTHPDVRRYFMLIPEAVQLVMHAATLAEGGEVFVLEMGEQIKLVDMARNLIRLSGFVPDEEIPITFVGLRPGEKLYEELIEDTETVDESGVEHIMKIRSAALPDPALLRAKVLELERYAMLGHTQSVLDALRHLIPGYRPAGLVVSGPNSVGAKPPSPYLPKSLSYAELGSRLSGQA